MSRTKWRGPSIDRPMADQSDLRDDIAAQFRVDPVADLWGHQGEFLPPDGVRDGNNQLAGLQGERRGLRGDPFSDNFFPAIHQASDIARMAQAQVGQGFPEDAVDSVNHVNQMRPEFFVGKASELRAIGLTIPYVVWQNRRPHKITGSSVESRFFGSEMRLLRFIQESEETPKPAL